jgi:Flp pilus assembly pilin Flp
MRNHWQHFWQDQGGTTAIEYGLIATILSIIAIGSMIAIGAQVDVFFNDMLNSFR